MKFTRRHLLVGSAAGFAAPLFEQLARPTAAFARAAQDNLDGHAGWRHAASLFGDLKYGPAFPRFDYVNASAPKGGTVRQIAYGTFDNFNLVISGVKGSLAGGAGLIYETLMVSSLDEVFSEYGLLAESIAFPEDKAWVAYRLRAEARWHDGRPVTPADVIFSFNALTKYNPLYGAYYSHVVKAEQTGERDVRFTFDKPGNRELPLIVGQLPILPKHWWEGSDASGKPRDISATTLEPPLGSAAYRIKEFVAGRSLALERVKDHWGTAIPVNIGTNNFDELRYEYFRDTTVAREAFKADQVDIMAENSAKNWATAYDFPAVHEKRVVLEEFPINNRGQMQCFAFNLRRGLFKDARLRRAFNYAFDFEEMNKQLFYGQYHRIASYFEGTELASSGLPQGAELAILETVRDKVPPEVFTAPYTNPVGGSPAAVRANLREAMRLLKAAGFEVKERKLVDPQGNPVSVEFLSSDPASERYTLFYKPSLERLGIDVRVRTVDDAQYENRIRNFDFDITTQLWAESLSPGNEQRDFWGSHAADVPGARNTIGIKNPAIDELIDRVIFARDRAELVAATHALDRVLLWNFYVVPHWSYGKMRYARWDRFDHPEPMPKYGIAAFPALWWSKADKAR